MHKRQIMTRLKNAMLAFIVTMILTGITIAVAKADDLTPEQMKIYDLGYKDGVRAGKLLATKRLVKLVQGTLKQRRLFLAVALTESTNQSKKVGGKIPIRFEHKWFRKCLNKKGVKTKHIPRALRVVKRTKKTNDYKFIKLAKKRGWSYCAHWATSYGKYQIMGFNYKAAGFDNPIQMSNAYHDNRTDEFDFKHFMLFIKNYRGGLAYRQLMSNKLISFSKTYNGSKKYVVKLKKNLKKAKKLITS